MNAVLKRAHSLLERLHPMPQNALNLRVAVAQSKEVGLREVLAKIDEEPADNPILPFSMFDNLHFARFLILDGPDHPETYGTTLVFMANVDGPADAFLDDLVQQAWRGLDGVDTIHFARWTMIDDGRRLLFTSNYDGSLESYMVDFIDKVAWGLNIIFSNGVGYPRTRWLVHEGARAEQRFKDYLGHHQIENQGWYTPYPHLTAVNIANNEAIRDGLRGNMNERQAQAWLQRL